MKATNIFVRFLSLLDVALVLLGVLMIALTQAQLSSDVGTPPNGLPELPKVEFIYLYAGWEGPQKGRCFLLNENLEIGREIRTDTADDIEELLNTKSRPENRITPVVMLLFDENGWYSDWDAKRLAQIEQTWKTQVISIYNVQLSKNAKP